MKNEGNAMHESAPAGPPVSEPPEVTEKKMLDAVATAVRAAKRSGIAQESIAQAVIQGLGGYITGENPFLGRARPGGWGENGPSR